MFVYTENNPVNFSDIEGLLGGIDMGESYGERASLYWATLAINPNNAWYQTAAYTFMGWFASLWTPTTSEATVSALALGYGAGRGQNEPYWRYTGPNSKPDSPWMTRGCEGKPPYGTDFRTAQDRLQMPHTPTDVKKVDVPWYQPVQGPRPADKNPLLGNGGGPEYARGWRWPKPTKPPKP